MYDIDKLSRLFLGRVGENEANEIKIDCSKWREEWPECILFALYVRPTETSPYVPAVSVDEEGVLTWLVDSTDVALAGNGALEIRAIDAENGKLRKTKIIQTLVAESMTGMDDDTAPGWEEAWQNRLAVAEGEAEQAAARADEATTNANEAAEKADTKATIASKAANTAIQNAAEALAASRSADRASVNANEATVSANTAATNANDAAIRANASAANAEVATASAETAATRANNAAHAAQTLADAIDETVQAGVETVNTAGTTNLNAVNQAGSSAIAGIQQKAESFPDYNQTQQQIGAIKENILQKADATEVDAIKGDKIDKPANVDNGKIPRAKNGEVEWVEVGQPTDAQTSVAVQSWLDKHPEATTTVQDGVITSKKIEAEFLERIENGYVTPEMYGAKKDGVNDDAVAINKAIDEAIKYHKSVIMMGTFYIKTPLSIGFDTNLDDNEYGMTAVIGLGGAVIVDQCVDYDYAINIKNKVIVESIIVKSTNRTNGCVVIVNSTIKYSTIKDINIIMNHNADGFVIDASAGGFSCGLIDNVNVTWAKNCFVLKFGTNGWITGLKLKNCNATQFTGIGLLCDYDEENQKFQFTQSVIDNFHVYANFGDSIGMKLMPSNVTIVNPVCFSDNTTGVFRSVVFPKTSKNIDQIFWIITFVGGMIEGQIDGFEYIGNCSINGTQFLIRNNHNSYPLPLLLQKPVNLIDVVNFTTKNGLSVEKVNSPYGNALRLTVIDNSINNMKIQGQIPADIVDTTKPTTVMIVYKLNNSNISESLTKYVVSATLSYDNNNNTIDVKQALLKLSGNMDTAGYMVRTIKEVENPIYRFVSINFVNSQSDGSKIFQNGDVVDVYRLVLCNGNSGTVVPINM